MEPRSGPGSSCLPINLLLAHPTLGRSQRIPRWQAMPNRLGWALPCPSHRRTSGRPRSFRSAASRTGTSRKERSPGTYGNSVFRQAIRASRMRRSRRSQRTAAATQRLPPGEKATSKPATYLNSDDTPDSHTCAAMRRWIATASRGRRFQRCGVLGMFMGAARRFRFPRGGRRQEASCAGRNVASPPDVGAYGRSRLRSD